MCRECVFQCEASVHPSSLAISARNILILIHFKLC
jgi:hypothetical protein